MSVFRKNGTFFSSFDDFGDQDLCIFGAVSAAASQGEAWNTVGDKGAARPSTLTSYTSGNATIEDANEFNIQINFNGRWTAEQQAVVTWAADFFSDIIIGDVRDDTDLNFNFVDDIVIDFSIGRIDGRGSPMGGTNILAETTITAVRDPGSDDQWLPVTASVKLDAADLKSSLWSLNWDTIIVHEIAHALGFIGPIFEALGLTDEAGDFVGFDGTTVYGGAIPLEDTGGALSAGSHWDEELFVTDGATLSNELMTGFIAPGESTYLSDTTVAAFADLGYIVQDPFVGGSTFLVESSLSPL
jgi:hypothetical protein